MSTASSRVLLVLVNVWFIAFAALAVRLTFAWNQQSKIPHQALATVPFDQESGNIALALSAGHGYANLFRRNTGPTAWLAPVYPFLLSLIFRVFGPLTLSSFFAAVLLNALCSAAATIPLYAIARRLAGPGVAAAACWFWVVLPAGVLMPFEWIWDTSLSVLLATTLVWLTLRVAESTTSRLWMAYGLLWALALLTNPALGVGLPFLFGWAATRVAWPSRRSWLAPGLSLAIVFLGTVPWTVRNYQRFHRVIPVRSSLPFELWIGNNDIFDEHAVHGIQRITRYEETHRYAELGENAYLDEKLRLARSFIAQKPALFAALTGRRIVATWFGTEHPYRDFLHADSLLLRVIFAVNLLLTLGTLAGLALLLLRKNPLALPLAVWPVFYPLIYYITHASLRYRHPIDPLLVLLAVFAAACCFRKREAARFLPGPL
jgi:hypothetical protein